MKVLPNLRNFGALLILLSFAPLYAHATTAAFKAEMPAPVACRFVETFRQSGHERISSWWFWRDDDRIETRSGDGAIGEIWERRTSGEIKYTKLYRNERQAIVHYPGDLRAVGGYPQWRGLATIIDASELDAHVTKTKLTKTGSTQVLGRSAEIYRGIVDGVRTEIWWLPDARLPAMVKKRAHEHQATLRLRNLWPLDGAPMQRTRPEQLTAYRHIDFADLGDMESDPFVQRMQHATGHSH